MTTETNIAPIPRQKILERDSRGRIVKTDRANVITVENAPMIQAARREAKRARVEAGALAALKHDDPIRWAKAQGLDYVEAIAEALTVKALNMDDAKQVDAARLIFKEAGIAETGSDSDADSGNAGTSTALLLRIAALAVDVLERRRDDVVDAG